MKILLYTGFTNQKSDFSSWATKTTNNKFEYTQKHNYDFLVERGYDNYDRPISWYKIKKIIDILPLYDWIVWMDADSLITNHTIKIEDIIQKNYERKKTVFLSPKDIPIECELPDLIDQNYIVAQDQYSPCMGIFMIKNSEWSINFFKRIYSKIEYLHDPIWDNRGQDYLFYTEPNLMENVKFVPKTEINSFTLDWESGHFIIHFPATESERRARYTDQYLEKVIK